MAAVVAVADCDVFRVEEGEEGVQGGEAGRVGQRGVLEQDTENCLEAGGVGGGAAGVNILVGCQLGVGSCVEGTEVVGVFVVAEGGCDVYGRGDVCVVVQKGVCVQKFRCERDIEVDVEVIEFGCGWGFGGVVIVDASMVGAIGGSRRHGAIASSN